MEGGFKPWRTQIIINNSPSLDSYGRPLPPPPSGCYWERREDCSWELKRFEIESDGGAQENFPRPSVLEHVVMPCDTIQGICLRYRVSAVELRRHNGFSGNNIQFSPALRIPIEHQMPITRQQETPEITQQRFKNITQESYNEASYYLGECDGDLERALVAWKEDKDWNDTHYYPNFSEQNSDVPLDESVHVAKRDTRRGWFKNQDKSHKVAEEGTTTATTMSTRPTESWTLVEDNDTKAVIIASTGVELLSTPQYESNVDDNSDIYVVPANVSWKYPKIESSKSVMISEKILSIFGRKRSSTTDIFGIPVEGNFDSVLRPLIDTNPGSRR